MKRFSFHLESILKLRTHREEECRRELGLANRRCATISQDINNLHREELSIQFSQGEDINYYHARELYLGRLRSRIAELEQEGIEAEFERKKAIDTYNKAKKECRAMQIIRDKKVLEHRKTWFKEEDVEIDNIVNARDVGNYSE